MQRYTLIVFILVSVFTLKAESSISNKATTEEHNKSKIMFLTAQGKNIKAEIRINDIPICRISPKYSSCTLKVTHYLESGDNSLTIITTSSNGKVWARISEHYKDEKIKFYDSKGFNDEKRVGELVKVTGANKAATFLSSLEGIKWQWKSNDILNGKEDNRVMPESGV